MKSRIPLDVIEIPKPCPADWSAMRGDDRVRFCDHCQLNVYNLSAMSRKQAEDLVNANEARLCVSFYRRADGTVITSDCGGGIRFAAKRAWKFASAAVAAAVCIVLSPLGLSAPSKPDARSPLEITKPTPPADAVHVVGGMPPPPRLVRGEVAVLGAVAAPMLGKVAPSTQPTTAPATRPAE